MAGQEQGRAQWIVKTVESKDDAPDRMVDVIEALDSVYETLDAEEVDLSDGGTVVIIVTNDSEVAELLSDLETMVEDILAADEAEEEE